MTDWTKEERIAAAERIATIRYGEEQMKTWRDAHVEAVLKAFDWNNDPNMTVHVSLALNLQCEVTALREALNEALPLLKEELQCLERSFLPEPNKDESDLLVAYRQSTAKIEELLTRITGGTL